MSKIIMELFSKQERGGSKFWQKKIYLHGFIFILVYVKGINT